MSKTITMKSSPAQILKQFRECPIASSVNLRTEKGFIFLVGGILNKLEGSHHYFAQKGKWIKLY